ncbi:MAG: hypothetical protein JRC90_10450 [Deltaproteobacteria bacterium]|nr:hypothetical protein [Deltaproteobacteria bacterium]
MPKTAIQEDVDKTTAIVVDTDITQVEPVVNAELDIDTKVSREEIMDRITARRNEEMQNDLEVETVKEVTTVEEEIEIEPSDKTVKIKVDGIESEVTEKEIREYQKQIAADKRLEDAAKKEKELLDRQAAIDAKEIKLSDSIKTFEEITKKTQAIKAEEDDDSEALADQLITSVFEEDKKTTAKILKKIRSKPETGKVIETQKIDRGELSQAVNLALSEEKRLAAVRNFEKNHTDIAKRPGLRTEVNERTKVEMREDPGASWEDVIERAVKYVRKDLIKLSGMKEVKKENDVKNELANRKEKKVVLGNSVTSTVSAKSSMTTKSAEPTLTVIQQMRKSRGQPY